MSEITFLYYDQEAWEEDRIKGLCEQRFHADINLYEHIKTHAVGDVVNINGRDYEITKVKNTCYSDCPIADKNINCAIKNKAFFAREK